jgi:hypothetical protein
MAAEPIKASVGGCMHIGVGVTDPAGGAKGDKIGMLRDGEIHF